MVGFKRKPGDEVMVHIRRYKLSGKHLEPIAPHKALALTLTLTLTLTRTLTRTLILTCKALASVQAASSLAGVLRALPADGEQMLDAELEAGDVLQVLELLSCGARLTLTLTRTRTRTRCSSSSAAANCACTPAWTPSPSRRRRPRRRRPRRRLRRRRLLLRLLLRRRPSRR